MTRLLNRIVVTGVVLGCGLFLLPFFSLPGSPFSWELFAQAYQADLSIQKVSNAPSPLLVGSQFSYTLTVQNLGPLVATGVVVDDILPPLTAYVSDSCGGTYTANTHSWLWQVGVLAVNAQASCDITVTVVGRGSLVNSVVVSGEQDDFVPDNNSDVVTDEGLGILDIPTLSPTGTFVLVALLTAMSLLLLLRRRRAVGPR